MGETLHRIQKAAEIPSDVATKVPILTMTGFESLTIENYRGIIEYTSKTIRILTICGQIRMTGIHLYIEYYTNEEMKVTGNIEKIEYEHGVSGGSA